MRKKNFCRFSFLLLLLFSSSLIVSAQTGSDTTCSNGISLYQKIYGGNKDEFGYASVLTSDSGYVIAGLTNSYGSGAMDALLMKVSKRGLVVWSKAMGGTGNDVFYQVRRTADNGFIACGQTKSYGNPAGDVWLVKTDMNGNIQWSKKYGDGNPSGEIAVDVIQLSDGGYAFCGTHPFAPGVANSLVVRTDANGNIVWSKQYGNGNSDDANGILEDGNFLIVSGYYYASSFYDGYVMKINKSDGAIQWMKGFDADGRSTWMSRMAMTSNGYQIQSAVTDDYGSTNQELCIWNISSAGTLQNARKLSIPGGWSISYGWQALADGGFVAVNSNNTSNSDIIVCKVTGNGFISWSKKYARTGVQQVAAVVASPRGYGLIGFNNNAGSTPDSNNVLVMRIDSLGYNGLCAGVNTNELTINTPNISLPNPDVTALGNAVISAQPITVTSTAFAPVVTTNCSFCQYIMPVVPLDTACPKGIPHFQRLYSGSKDDAVNWITMAADSGYIMAGQTNSFGNGGYDGLLLKVNKNGNVQWNKAFGGAGYDNFYMVRKTSDNGFIAVGQTKSFGNAAGDGWLVKLDAAGNLQWSKKYGDGNPAGEIAYDVIQLSDGGYAFCGSHKFQPGSVDGWVTRTDNLGNVIWSKQYGMSGSDQTSGLVEDGNFLIVTGFYQGTSYYDGYIMKLDKANGAIVWVKGHDAEDRSTWMSRIVKTTNGYQAMSIITDNYFDNNQQQCIWNFNPDGTVQNVRKLSIPGIWTLSYGWLPFNDGGFATVNSDNSVNSDMLFCRVNAAGNIISSKKYQQPGKQIIYGMTSTIYGGIAAAGYNNTPGTIADSNNVQILKLDSLGDAGPCTGVFTNEITVVVPTINSGSAPIVDGGAVTIANPVITVNVTSQTPEDNILCFYCKPKPTGMAMPVTYNEPIHDMRVFPNPVLQRSFNLVIDAAYSDRAIISLVDLSGNTLHLFGSREISMGKNQFLFTIPSGIKPYSNYFIRVRFSQYGSALKLFVLY